MAYRLETQKIVPGGLNLVGPGDQVRDEDCLDLLGVFSGSAGRIEAAPTDTNLSGGSGLDSVCDVDGVLFTGGGGSLYAGGGSVDDGYDGFPLGLVAFKGYLWVMNRAKQRKVKAGGEVTDWTPAPPGTVTLIDGGTDGSTLVPPADNPPLVGGLGNKEYTYYVTWMVETGESPPSPAAKITPAVDGSIVRIMQPSGAPIDISGWNIYREVGGTPYLLNEDGPLPPDRTYVDDYGDDAHTQSDEQMLALGVIMQGEGGAAPPARVMANQAYNGRLVVASSETHPNRIWYTPSEEPGTFRGSANEIDGDWVDCSGGDPILAMIVRPAQLVIYRMKSIWRHVGDFDDPNARLEPVIPDMGIEGPRGVYPTSLGDFFRSGEGVYLNNGDWAKKVSGKVEAIFRGQAVEGVPNETDPTKCAIGFENSRVWVSYDGTNQLCYHPETDRWFRAPGGYGAYGMTGNGLVGVGDGVFLIGDSWGSTTLRFQSAYYDASLPDHEKTWADLVISHNLHGGSADILLRLNKGNDEIAAGSITSSAATKTIFQLVDGAGDPLVAYNLSVRISGSDIPRSAVIDGPILLHYYVEARQAKTFDSAPTDHGTQEAKRIDQVELRVNSATAGALTGGATVYILSDLPGGVMTDRIVGGQALPATVGGQQVLRFVLEEPIEGRLLRYGVSNLEAGFKLYAMRVRILVLPQTLDGFVGDAWQPEPISI